MLSKIISCLFIVCIVDALLLSSIQARETKQEFSYSPEIDEIITSKFFSNGYIRWSGKSIKFYCNSANFTLLGTKETSPDEFVYTWTFHQPYCQVNGKKEDLKNGYAILHNGKLEHMCNEGYYRRGSRYASTFDPFFSQAFTTPECVQVPERLRNLLSIKNIKIEDLLLGGCKEQARSEFGNRLCESLYDGLIAEWNFGNIVYLWNKETDNVEIMCFPDFEPIGSYKIRAKDFAANWLLEKQLPVCKTKDSFH